MSRSRRTDLMPMYYAGWKADDGNHWVLIILFEPEEPNTTVEIGTFFSTGQILNRFKKDKEWLVNEECGNDVINEIEQLHLLPVRSSIPPRFAYGEALEDFQQVTDDYKEKVKQLKEKIKGSTAENDNGDEPKQLTAPKDPKSRPN